ncbi:MAG: FixH family protein [Chitinophagaceae bacterium]|nr:FixH family protein [Chitinophagaceae bacterium]
MKKIILPLLTIVLFSFVVLTACTKNDIPEPDPTQGLTKLTEGYAAGASAKVEVYMKGSQVNTGYTRFYIALYDSVSGKRMDESHIHLTPMMDMGSMQHSAPYENPSSENAVNHLFSCSVVFIMPSTSGTWTLKVQVHNHLNGKEGSLTIPITVTDPVKATTKSFISLNDGGKYFVSLIEPSSPKVGINDMEIAIYKKKTMMEFPADSSLSVTLTPEMPTMGHGSPNNINPVHIGNGHYKGKVNFTMTGLWRLNLDFAADTAVADSTFYFDTEF